MTVKDKWDLDMDPGEAESVEAVLARLRPPFGAVASTCTGHAFNPAMQDPATCLI